jgi:phenylacetate-CoA ligase
MLENSQRQPRQALLDQQWRRLQELLDFAARHNRFYRRLFAEAGVRAEDIRAPEDLARLPLLTKAHVRAHVDELISEGLDLGQLHCFKTGGSTGKALVLFATEEVSEKRNAATRRTDRWSGWEVGEPVGAVWGNPPAPDTIKAKLRAHWLAPVIYLDTMAINEASMRAFGEAWRRTRPSLLYGHAHSLYILARFCLQAGFEAIQPRAIIATSMMLLDQERQVIERAFGRPVFDRYGCEEVGPIASECEVHHGMHVNTEHVLVEFAGPDGRPAPLGAGGEVIVTDLLNRAMPMIRYQVEDMAAPLPGDCPCGRGLPLMGRVQGRVADFLVRRDGTRVAGVSLIENTLTRIKGLVQMQIVQQALDRIVLNVVVAPEFGAAEERELTTYFCQTFPGAAVEICRVAGIPQEPNGKYRFSICRVGQ